MLTEKQRDLLLLIARKMREHGVPPSFDEMRLAMGMKSKSGVHRIVKVLEERGFVHRLPHRARALEILKMPTLGDLTPTNNSTTKPHNNAGERRGAKGRRIDDTMMPDFRDLVENSVQGVLVHSNFRPLYANASFAALFGYTSPQDITTMPLVRPLIPEDAWAQTEERYGNFMRGHEQSAETRMRGVRRDGSEIWLHLIERRIDWHGTPAVHISAFDINERMVVEQALMERENLMRAILETLPVPIYIARLSDARLLFVNRKTCLLFQQGASVLLKKSSTDFYVDPEERKNLSAIMDTLPDIRDVEVRMRTAHGREFIVELAAIRMMYSGEAAVLVALNDISQRKQLEVELFQQANTDTLTNISNRRYFMNQAEQEMRRSRRFERPLAILMLDVDHFKVINDSFGHEVGDSVLQGVVAAALESLRQSDIMGRLGGEEFACLLPETPHAAAMEVARRLCEDVASKSIVTVKGAIYCSVSIGVAQLQKDDASIDDLLRRADEAMYCAKHAGRNTVREA